MKIQFLLELAFLGRLFIAGLCGAIIGYERNNRLKEAGTRTHLIVALAASLIMIVSKYGFADVTSYQGIALDPSRIAAQIVTGVGFLGAGMIFVRNQNISGLTTAAGVWATAGIGMCIGAGLYFLGIAATALVVIAQMVLHRQYTWLRFPVVEQIHLVVEEEGDGIAYLKKTFQEHYLEVISLKLNKRGDGFIDVSLTVKVPPCYNLGRLMALLKDNPHIKSLEL